MSKSPTFFEEFGSHLLSPTGESVRPSDALAGKVVLIYFSAHWCPPCRRFTSLLVNLYKKLKSKSVDFEIVYVSFDNFEIEYKAYAKTMPWLVTPYHFTEKNKLTRKYKAEGIPHLAVIDAEGEVITLDGTSEVQLDENGYRFPWKPKTLEEIWPQEILTQKGKQATTTLEEKYIMLYFSANWCPPCQKFTPILSEAYTKLKSKRDDFELIFISSDRDAENFNEYFAQMTFCAVPFEDKSTRSHITKRFEVTGIPKLIILGPVPSGGGDRPIINDNIRGMIENGEFDEFPFRKKRYGDLSRGGEDINEKICLMIFHENGDDEEQENVVSVVKAVSEKFKKREDMRFYWAIESKGMVPRVREALSREKVTEHPLMVILDLPDNGAYYVSKETEINFENVMKFICGKRKRQQLM